MEGDQDAQATSAKTLRTPTSKFKTRNDRTASEPPTSRTRKDELASDGDGAAAVPKSISLRASPIPMTVTRAIPLLICGIGNPGSTYANTLHSTGLTILNRLADHLSYPSFQKDRTLGNGLVSKPPHASPGESGNWTLWQSTSYMNESGKGVKAAWTNWSRALPDGEGGLVVVYDELEKPLGAVTVRTNLGASAKGHNGLKSIMAVVGNVPFARIGVGIGRPVSRESDDVARYVLGKMTGSQREAIEGAVGEVVRKLRELEKG